MSPPTPKNGNTTGTWHEIMDPNGDITLFVGKQEHKFRVARNILSLSSPVFAKMLAPDSHFMEAQVTDLSGDGTKHIGLLEDELESFTLVLRIMHHRTKDIPTQLSLDLLAKVASLCDKYDFLGCIRPWTASWCICPMAKDDRRWLLIAFVFENTQAFQEITKSLILNAGRYLETSDIVNNLDGVPVWIMGQLRACRADALRKLAEIITQFSNKLIMRNARPSTICQVLEDKVLKRQVCDATALGDLATYYPKAVFPDPDILDVKYTLDTDSVTSYVLKLKDTKCTGKLIYNFTQGKTTLSHSLCQPNVRLLPEMQEIVNGVTGLSLDPPFQTFVTMLSGKTITIQSFASDTIWMMKIKIREHEHIPIAQQRLVFGEMQLSNDLTLQHYKIAKHASMRLVLRVAGCGCRSGEPEVWEASEHAPQA